MIRRTKAAAIALALAGTGVTMASPAIAATGQGAGVEVLLGRAGVQAALPESLAQALAVANEFAKAHPDDLAPPWADRASGVLVVPTVTATGTDVAAALRARLGYTVSTTVTTAPRSWAQLAHVIDEAIELTRQDVPGAGAIIATYVDAQTDRAVVLTNAAPAGLLDLLATRYGADSVAVREVPGARRPDLQARNNDTSPFWGGSNINVPAGGCTSGFPWLRNASHVMMSAGHCAPTGGAVTTPPSTTMGSVANASGENWNTGTGSVFLTGQSAYKGDLSRISMTSPQQAGTNIFVGGVNSSTTKAIGSMFSRRGLAGDSYCTGGAYSGEICGWTISTTGGNVTYSNGEVARNVSTGTKSAPCTIPGDSGGPVYSTGTTVSAMGIHNGGGPNSSPCFQVFTDIWNAWDAFGGFPNMAITSDGDRRTSTQQIQQAHRLTSPNGQYTLEMQGDGNLVIYKPGHISVWATNTNASANEGAYAVMQADGNFVLYKPGGASIWASNTQGRAGAYIRMQDDCNLVIYLPTGQSVWASNTSHC